MLKHPHKEVTMSSRHEKRKYLSAKPTLAGIANKFNVDAVMNPAFAPMNYYKIISERSQAQLRNALIENENLQKSIKDLKQHNKSLKEMLNEADDFIEDIKEEFAKIEAHFDVKYDQDDMADDNVIVVEDVLVDEDVIVDDDDIVEVVEHPNDNGNAGEGNEKEETEAAP